MNLNHPKFVQLFERTVRLDDGTVSHSDLLALTEEGEIWSWEPGYMDEHDARKGKFILGGWGSSNAYNRVRE
jgi:hypothetical protein